MSINADALTNFLLLLVAVLLAGGAFQYFSSQKKIKQIGRIACKRCNYTGLPKHGGNLFSPKIVCPGCGSEQWEKTTKAN